LFEGPGVAEGNEVVGVVGEVVEVVVEANGKALLGRDSGSSAISKEEEAL